MSENFAVVDCETTGLGNADRIIEVAVVVLDGENLETIDEFDTLVNPMRDVGKTDLHGITATMVAAAPTMDEVIGNLARKLNGAVLVAHNLAFDARMIANEFGRLGIDFNKGVGICTLKLTGERLSKAAERHGIPLIAHHRAIADARVAAELLRRTYEMTASTAPVEVTASGFPSMSRTYRRDASELSSVTPLNRLISNACYPSSIDVCREYFDLLDWVLDDAVITGDEQLQLDELVSNLELPPSQVRAMHESYLSSLAYGTQRDGIITANEHQLLQQISSILKIGEFVIPNVTVFPEVGSLKKGMRICFTGTAQDVEGNQLERSDLEKLAASNGMQAVDAVTKSKCDLLVTADPSSMSGKARKARDFGIPLMSVLEFLEAIRK